jgi:thymidylate synthase
MKGFAPDHEVAYACLIDEALKGAYIKTRNSNTFRVRNFQTTFETTPLICARRTAWKSALREMEWFLSGSNNINDLHPSVHKWWKPWANESGFIHNNYGKQLRSFDGAGFGPVKVHNSVDQIQYMIDTLKNNPHSRRNVITTWHTHDMVSPNTPITNCHGTVIQAFVENGELHITMYQRSADIVLGLPHNWIQYWAFMMWMSVRTGLCAGTLTWIGGDCHIYEDHSELAGHISNVVFDYPNYGKIVPVDLYYIPTSKEFKADDFSLSGDYNPVIKKSPKMIV